MARDTIKLTRKLMRAIEAEPKRPNQWCERTLEQLCEFIGIKEKEFKPLVDYAFHKRLIALVRSGDGHIVRIGDGYDDWTDRNEPFWNFERRNVIIGTVLLLIAVFLAWLEYKKP